MRIDRRTFLAAAMLVGAATAPALAAPLKFSVSAEPYPPFASKSPAGVWEGFEVDLARAVCKAASLDCEIVETAWDGIIPALLSKKSGSRPSPSRSPTTTPRRNSSLRRKRRSTSRRTA
jgi:ABC-type amino acid transport substrate-binding protein